MRYPRFKGVYKARYFFAGITVIILLMLIVRLSPTKSEMNLSRETLLPGDTATDSLVIDQLIARSISFFETSGSKGEVIDTFLAEALNLAVTNQRVVQEAIIYNMVGRRLRNRAQYLDAIKYHKRALNLAQASENQNLLAEVYNQLGVVYRRVDENTLALDMHVKALQISEAIKDTFNISVAINSIGNVNFNLHHFHSAIEYFRRSLALSEIAGNTLGLAINNHNIGESHLQLGYPWLALDYFYRALDYNIKAGSSPGQAICFNSIGAAYIVLENYNLALEYLQRALKINQDLGNVLQTSVSYAKIGEVHMLKEEYLKAYDYLERSFNMAAGIGVRFQAEESARLLSLIYESRGEYKRSLDYYKIAVAYKDTILNEKNLYHLSTLQTIMAVDAQHERIAQLSQQSIIQQSTLGRQRLFTTVFGVMVVVLLGAGILIVYQFRLRAKYKFLKNQQKLLRSQMNPHFIFNALSAIHLYVLQHDVERSTRYLTDFAKLMRQVLKVSQLDFITLSQEKEILTYYLELQNLQFNSPFVYNISLDVPGGADSILVPPMITQPFVENAVEHGIKSLEEQGRLDIRFKQVNSQVIIEVEDNGVGINTSRLRKEENGRSHESMALKITKERLDVLCNDTGGKTKLEIIDKRTINPFDRGTLVRVMLPFIKPNSSKVYANGKPKSNDN